MKRSAIRSIAVLALCAAAVAVPARGQSDVPPASDELMSLSYPGGAVADYVDAVRKAGGVNVYIDPAARDVPMPRVDLKNVSPGAALQLLHGRTALIDGNNIELHYDEIAPVFDSERPIFTVRAQVSGRRADRSGLQNSVWSATSILEMGVKPDDMLTAVQTALDLIGKDKGPAELRFHYATAILIARASGEQISAIDEVISKLQESAHQKQNARSAERDQQIMAREAAIQQLQQRITELEASLAAARKN